MTRTNPPTYIAYHVPASTAGAQGEGGSPAPDIGALALEVYAEVLRLIDVARERNGEPYL